MTSSSCRYNCQIEGYYPDHGLMECRKCHDNCATCVGSGYKGTCTSCKGTNYYTPQTYTCDTGCPGQFYKGNNFECKQCSQQCLTCEDSADNCKTCASGYFEDKD